MGLIDLILEVLLFRKGKHDTDRRELKEYREQREERDGNKRALFRDYSFTAELERISVPATITGAALEFLWERDNKFRGEEGLIKANEGILNEVIFSKLELTAVPDQTIVINRADLDEHFSG